MSEFLRRNGERALAAWELAIRAIPAAALLDRDELHDHMPLLIARVLKVLEGQAESLTGELPDVHAIERLREGLNLKRVPSLTLAASRLAITPAGNDGSISLAMPSAAIADVRTLTAMGALPSDVCVARGRIDASMHVESDLGSGSANGDGQVVVRELRARFGATGVAAGVTVDVRARPAASEGSTTLDSVELSGTSVAVADGSIGQTGGTWSGILSMGDAILRFRDRADFHANVNGTATHASPATAILVDNAGCAGLGGEHLSDAPAANRRRDPCDLLSLELRSVVARGGGSEGWFERKSALIRSNTSSVGVGERQPTPWPSPAVGTCVP